MGRRVVGLPGRADCGAPAGLGHGNLNDEGGALADLALDGERALMPVHDMLDDGKAKAGAAPGPRGCRVDAVDLNS